jgi:hypothetical protein
MSSTSEKSSTIQSLLSAQTIVISSIVWGVLALLFFLLFSVPDASGGDKPEWYVIGTYIFECSAFLSAAVLCLRNWKSPVIVSGRNVWLGIGVGMSSYFIGNLLFGCWELLWGLNPDVSLADLFYMVCYVSLSWGMVLAVSSRRLNLEKWQWGVLVGMAVAGIALAVWVATPPAEPAATAAPEQAAATATPASGTTAATIAPALQPNAKPAAQAAAPQAVESEPEEEENSTAPGWVQALDKTLKPIARYVNLFYIIGDVFLLIIATALLLAFWGGRFSQSWRMIAAATFCLYIADMWFKYADSHIQGEYQSGSLLEVFFVFCGVLFGIGAVLEYDISTRSRRPARKRG